MSTTRKVIAVYQIRNVVNGKYYVGSSANLYERWRTHRNKLRASSHPNAHLQAAWNKYTEDAFKFEVIRECTSVAEMEALEQQLISDSYGSTLLYNISEWVAAPMRGRFGPLNPNFGKSMTEQQKAQLSAAAKQQWQDADPRTGTTHSAETKATISAKVQAALAEGRGGKFIPSAETRKKMSDALKGNQCAKGHVRTQEHRQRLSEANKGNTNWLGKNHSEESKEKLRRPILVTFPDGTEVRFSGLSELRDTHGISLTTIIRACKSGNPIKAGPHAGWVLSYQDGPKNEAPAVSAEFSTLPRTREVAKSTGAKEYFTGLPCLRGHIAPRKTKGSCTECVKEDGVKDNARRLAQPKSEAAKAAGRRYYERNKELVKERAKRSNNQPIDGTEVQ